MFAILPTAEREGYIYRIKKKRGCATPTAFALVGAHNSIRSYDLAHNSTPSVLWLGCRAIRATLLWLGPRASRARLHTRMLNAQIKRVSERDRQER
jgi:hypothetical protein